MVEVLERWRWYIVALLAVPMLVGVGVLLESELEGRRGWCTGLREPAACRRASRL